MKAKEKNLARTLRAQGWSLNRICKKLNVSKSSVSLWVRDIGLTKFQRQKIEKGRFSREIVEKTRLTRIQNEEIKRKLIVDKAKQEVGKLSNKDLFLLGVSLYWAEGGKTKRGLVRISNGDPLMISLVMQFFREICEVPEDKFRGYIHIHPHLSAKKAEYYWSRISRIPLSRFYKTYRKKNKSSQNKKDTLPYGTFEIYVLNTELFLKIKGWTEGIQEAIIHNELVPTNHTYATVAQW